MKVKANGPLRDIFVKYGIIKITGKRFFSLVLEISLVEG